jgi:hypothetical protein
MTGASVWIWYATWTGSVANARWYQNLLRPAALEREIWSADTAADALLNDFQNAGDK